MLCRLQKAKADGVLASALPPTLSRRPPFFVNPSGDNRHLRGSEGVSGGSGIALLQAPGSCRAPARLLPGDVCEARAPADQAGRAEAAQPSPCAATKDGRRWWTEWIGRKDANDKEHRFVATCLPPRHACSAVAMSFQSILPSAREHVRDSRQEPLSEVETSM